jgi:hypothetical protein
MDTVLPSTIGKPFQNAGTDDAQSRVQRVAALAPALLRTSVLMLQELPVISKEELRVHTETDADGVGTQADADTERLAEEDIESAEERRRSAYRLT